MNNMRKKYLVIGGTVSRLRHGVPSKYDMDLHFISARRLVDLYGVDIRECILTTERDERKDLIGISPVERSLLIRLFPRYDGDYSLSSGNGIAA